MRYWLYAVGAGLALAGAGLAQRDDPGFTAGATNLLLAANGGSIVAFSGEMLDENKKPVPQWQVTNLIDGKRVTGTYRPEDSYGWSANVAPRQADPAWVIFAFKDEKTRLITKLVLDPSTVDPPVIGRGARDFELYASTTNKDGPWALIKSGRLLQKPIPQSFEFLPVEARYLRLAITANWGSDRFVELGEAECYEAIAGDEVIDQLIIRLEDLLRDLKRYRDSVKLNQPLFPELKPAAGAAAPTAQPATPATAPATPATGAQ
jgi:hypothetical protein